MFVISVPLASSKIIANIMVFQARPKFLLAGEKDPTSKPMFLCEFKRKFA